MNQIIFLDRDGTLNPDPGYISSVTDFSFYPYTLRALKKLSSAGYKFIILTNQSGVARGFIKENDLKQIHNYIIESFRDNTIPLLDIYYCPHHPTDNCECRKPKPGMAYQAAKDHSFEPKRTYIIGDSFGDMVIGHTIGIKTILTRTGKGKKTELQLNHKEISVDFVGDTLSDCADYILSKEI